MFSLTDDSNRSLVIGSVKSCVSAQSSFTFLPLSGQRFSVLSELMINQTPTTLCCSSLYNFLSFLPSFLTSSSWCPRGNDQMSISCMAYHTCGLSGSRCLHPIYAPVCVCKLIAEISALSRNVWFTPSLCPIVVAVIIIIVVDIDVFMMFISHFSIYLPCLSQLEREINLVVRRQTRWLSNEVVYDAAAAALTVHITVIWSAYTHPYVQMNQLNDQDRMDGQVSQLSFVKSE